MYDQSEQELSPPPTGADTGLWDWHRFDGKNLVEIAEFRPHMPLHNFYEGFSAAKDGNIAVSTIEDAQDRIRAVLEECDNLRAVQALVDMDSSWGGLALEMLTYIGEECPGSAVALFGNDWAYPLPDQVDESVFGSPSDIHDRSKMEARRRVNIASSLALLSDVASFVVPTAMARSSLPRSRFAHLSVDRSSCVELSSLAATSLELAMSAYRGKSVREMAGVVTPSMRVLGLAAAFPHLSDPVELLRADTPRLDEQYSLLPCLAADKKAAQRPVQHKLHRCCLNFTGMFRETSSLDAAIESIRSPVVVAQWGRRNALSLPETYRLRDLAGARADGISELSLSSDVGAYLGTVAQQVKSSDKRVLFEYTRAGMSPDALEELHTALTGLGDAYLQS